MTTFNEKLWRWRDFKDQSARVWVTVGGISVIAAIVLIFFYLLYVVLPIFNSAEIEKLAEYPVFSAESRTLYLDLEEQGLVEFTTRPIEPGSEPWVV